MPDRSPSQARTGQLPVWFGVPFLVAGLLAAAIGFVLLQDEQRYGREGVSVAGVVIETVYSSGGEDGPSYSIRYEFVDPATGSRHGGESDVSEETYDSSSAGNSIEVTYLPVEPTKSRIGSPEPQLLVPLAVMGMGAIFAAVGSGLLVLMLAIRRQGVPSATSAPMQVALEAAMQIAPEASPDPTADPFAGFSPEEEPPRVADRPISDAELRALDARLAPPADGQ